MLRPLFAILFVVAACAGAFVAEFVGAAPEAWAQVDPAVTACAQASGAEDCAERIRLGAWGLIVLGLLFFALWLSPGVGSEGKERGAWSRLPMLQAFQRRLEKEMTGWRRLQWPVLGTFFVGLGIVYLAGWR